MFLNELHKRSEEVSENMTFLKRDIEEYLKEINPTHYDLDTKEYLFAVMETIKYSRYLLIVKKIIVAIKSNKPSMLLTDCMELQKLQLDCGNRWSDYQADFDYIVNVFTSCENAEKLIKKKNLDFDAIDLSNPCAIADGIETVADCLKDVIYLSEVGDDSELEDALEDIKTYKVILGFLMTLI